MNCEEPANIMKSNRLQIPLPAISTKDVALAKYIPKKSLVGDDDDDVVEEEV